MTYWANFDAVLTSVPGGFRGGAGAVLGAIVGSFLGTVLIRWPQGRSAAGGRSQCDGCGAALSPAELVPIFSYLASRGRCRRCGGRVDPRHVAIEAAAALIGLASLVAHPGMVGLATAIFGWWLLILAALDFEEHWLPDLLTLPLIPAGPAVALLGYGPDVAARSIGAAAGFAALFLIGLVYRKLRRREGLGGGDPKLLAAIGAWVGWQQLPQVLLGAGVVGLVGLLLMRARGKPVAMSHRLPLGTLMALAAWPLWLMTAAT